MLLAFYLLMLKDICHNNDDDKFVVLNIHIFVKNKYYYY